MGEIINKIRRQIVFGMAGLLASRPETILASDKDLQPPASAYEPTGAIYWAGQSMLWIGGFRKKTALIRQSFGVSPSIVSFVEGQQSCKTSGDQLLLGGSLKSTVGLDLSDVQLKLRPIGSDWRPISDCKYSLTKTREQLEKSGLHGIMGLGPMGRKAGAKRTVSNEYPILACRSTPTDSTELIYSDGKTKVQLKTIDWPLARDNPVIKPDEINGGWIAYPSLILERRLALQKVTKGIQVTHISEQFDVTSSFVPWYDWSLESSYRIYVSNKGLIFAAGQPYYKKHRYKPGIYLSTGKDWALRFPGNVDIGSVAVAPEGGSVAWREQISMNGFSSDYGNFRHVIRLEQI